MGGRFADLDASHNFLTVPLESEPAPNVPPSIPKSVMICSQGCEWLRVTARLEVVKAPGFWSLPVSFQRKENKQPVRCSFGWTDGQRSAMNRSGPKSDPVVRLIATAFGHPRSLCRAMHPGSAS